MIYLFRIISDENPNFHRDLVSDGSDTFLDFHKVLQEDLGYDASQLASFFICNENWEKQQEITLIDMMQDPGVETLTMEAVTLEEYLVGLNQRMIYVFDFFSERAFFIELIELSDQQSRRQTPFVADAKEDPPPQLALDKLLDDVNLDEAAYEDEDEENPGSDLRIDDLDPDMFEAGNPEDY